MNQDSMKNSAGGRSRQPLIKLNPDTRFYIFLIAVALVIAGQIIIHRDVPIDSWLDMRQSINEWLRVDAKYLGNVIFGMVSTILGGLLFSIASFRTELSQATNPIVLPLSSVPILKKLQLSKWIWRTLMGAGVFTILIIRAYKYDLEFFDLFFWILAIFFFSSAIFRYDRASGTRLSLQTSRKDITIIIFILIAGLMIGTYQLENIPNIIKGDEGSFFEVAKFIANGEYHESIFGFGVYSFPSFSSYIQGGIMRVFGRDLWGWRFSSLLPALLSAIPLYLLGRDFFNRWVGFISTLIYISSPYFLSFARLGYNNSQAILFVVLTFWLFYQGLKRESLFYLYLSGAVSGLGFLTYSAGKLGIVVVLLSFIYAFLTILRKKGGKKFLLIGVIVFLIGAAIIASPHLVYGTSHNPEALRNKLVESLFINLDYVTGLFGTEDIYQNSTLTTIDRYQVILNPALNAKLLLRGFVRSFLGLQSDEYSTNYFLTTSLAGPIRVVFYVLGLYYLLARFWKPSSFPFLVWFLSGMIFLSVISTYPPRPAHLVVILPMLALFSGLGLYLSVQQISQYIQRAGLSREQWQPLLLIIGTLAILIAGVRQYFVESPQIYKPNLEQVMNWAGLENPPETRIYYVYGDESSQEWVPYFFRVGLAQAEFESFSYSAVQDGSAVWPGGSDFAIFIEEYHTAELLPLFKKELGKAEFITLRDRDDKPIGRIIINGEVTLFTAVSFWRGLGNMLISRVLWILLPLVAVGFYYFYQISPDLGFQKLKASSAASLDYLRKVPFIRSLLDTYASRQQDDAEAKPSRFFQTGLFWRWSTRKTRHEFEIKLSLDHRTDPKGSQVETDGKDG